jgi:hypothetical protein
MNNTTTHYPMGAKAYYDKYIKYTDDHENEIKKHYTVWTEDDDKYLLKLILLNYKYYEIAYYLERTEDAIKARFVKTILLPKYTKQLLNDNIDKLCDTFDIAKNDMVRYIKYIIPSFEIKVSKNKIAHLL